MKRIDSLKDMLEKNQKDPFLYFALAKEYEKNNLIEEAQRYYLDLVVMFEDYTGTYYHLAKLYIAKNDISAAIDTIKKGIDICTEKKDFHAKSELEFLFVDIE
jgi:tetratricopeptide (TPR) repeat protein